MKHKPCLRIAPRPVDCECLILVSWRLRWEFVMLLQSLYNALTMSQLSCYELPTVLLQRIKWHCLMRGKQKTLLRVHPALWWGWPMRSWGEGTGQKGFHPVDSCVMSTFDGAIFAANVPSKTLLTTNITPDMCTYLSITAFLTVLLIRTLVVFEHVGRVESSSQSSLKMNLWSQSPRCEVPSLHIKNIDGSWRQLLNSGAISNDISKILHQSWKTVNVPEKYLDWQKSWRRNHPDWS